MPDRTPGTGTVTDRSQTAEHVPPTSTGRTIPDRVVRPLDGADSEARVVDPTTGGEKGQKPARFDLLPAAALFKVAAHYGVGAAKYDDHNWRRGYAWSLSFGAMMRHAWAFWHGEDDDPETGTPHMAAVVFHALALLTFADEHPELDDRFAG